MRTIKWMLSGLLLTGCAHELIEILPTDPADPEPAAEPEPVDAAPVDAAPVDAAANAEPPGFNDDFMNPTLADAWRILRPDVLEIEPNQGALDVTLTQRSLWYNHHQGPAIYQNISGDFRLTSRVRTRRHGFDALPNRAVQLAGLMARDGVSDQENYVFIVVGYDVNDLSVETKTTVNGRSQFVGPPWPNADAELRICRLGPDFRLYKRPIGGAEWTLAATHERPDLPVDLQVGLVVYTNVQPADVAAQFEAVEFAPVADAADCAAP